MRIAFIGDIVGRPGRYMVREYLPKLRKEFGLDFVVANFENSSHGFGITPKNAKELLNYGIDAMTGGNHTLDKKEIIEYLDKLPLIRPLNFPEKYPGVGYRIFEVANRKVAIINLIGNYGMPLSDNPFTTIEKVLPRIESDHILIDFHSEATAEKRTLFMMLAGRVDMVVGTHTHVATDDYQLYRDSFYITDIGLTGCYDNIIGMESTPQIHRVLTGISSHHKVPEPSKCKKVLQMVVADLEKKEGFTYKVFENGDSATREVFYI
ncbi:MAG TPA: YmdB family metallophosphoesterase [Campylobacterales bacterium]|nr:YmdB family metallophosphoesterase [Campylobacterales bacterium]